jgi:hypothetical protein
MLSIVVLSLISISYAYNITNIIPNTGPTFGGTIATIYGYDFPRDAIPLIGGTSCIEYRVLSETEIVCVTPPGCGMYQSVTINDLSIQNNLWSYESPNITKINPLVSSVIGGELLTITGTNFYNIDYVHVKFYFTKAQVLFSNYTTIIVIIPSGSGASIPLQVCVSKEILYINECTITEVFSYYFPEINKIDPDHGSVFGGDIVTIYGNNFTEDSIVTIGDKYGWIHEYTHWKLIIKTSEAPQSKPGEQPMFVISHNQISNLVMFYYI